MKTPTLFLLLLLVPVVAPAQVVTGTWSARSSAGFVGSMGLASAVYDGKIYVFGGTDWSNGGLMSLVQIYDPASDTWHTPIISGDFPAREGISAVTLGDRIYVVGGSRTAFDSLQIFDPKTLEGSTPAATGAAPPTGWIPPVVSGGKIYVFQSVTAGPSVEVFDTFTSIWSIPSLIGDATPRYIYGAAQKAGDTAIVLGSADGVTPGVWLVALGDPTGNVLWRRVNASGSFSIRDYFSTCVLGNTLYTLGGYGAVGNFSTSLGTFEAFDLTTATWLPVQTSGGLIPRNQLTVATVGNTIYAIGGLDTAGRHDDVQAFGAGGAGVPRVQATDATAVFPNPFSATLTVSAANLQSADVYDILGARLRHIEARGNVELDLSDLPRGTYILHCRTPEGESSRVLEKE